MNDPSPIDRQNRVRDLYEEASALSGTERSAFLDRACGEDEDLHREVTSLLFETESVESPIEGLVDEVIWPALKSLSGNASNLEDWLDDRLKADAEGTDLLIGRTISHFEILEPIGRGGMGMVYRANDRALDRVVALKFLPPSMSSDKAAKNRFIHEAKAASGLSHPNIATVHEIGETEDQQLFIAMGFYPGQTLKERLEQGPIAPEEAVDIALQLVTGLKEAHEHGVIHRDIKPGNIMVSGEGGVVLLDFGLAKLSHESGYTQVGQMMGTIAYMSPEQARGDSVDLRTDIWSFGVVLYELLTGRPPFHGDNVQTVIRAILEDDPKPPVTSDGEITERLKPVLGLAWPRTRITAIRVRRICWRTCSVSTKAWRRKSGAVGLPGIAGCAAAGRSWVRECGRFNGRFFVLSIGPDPGAGHFHPRYRGCDRGGQRKLRRTCVGGLRWRRLY